MSQHCQTQHITLGSQGCSILWSHHMLSGLALIESQITSTGEMKGWECCYVAPLIWFIHILLLHTPINLYTVHRYIIRSALFKSSYNPFRFSPALQIIWWRLLCINLMLFLRCTTVNHYITAATNFFSFEVLILSSGRQLADSSGLADKCRDILPDTGQGSPSCQAVQTNNTTVNRN